MFFDLIRRLNRPRKRRVHRWHSIEVLEERRLLTGFVVDTPFDDVSVDGRISLREAITAANTNSSFGDAPMGQGGGVVDTISFDAALNGQIIAIDGTELIISDDLSINGPGAGLLTISGEDSSRIFFVQAGVTASISGTTLANGSAYEGGGIYNEGNLALTDSLLTANEGNGGAVFNVGGSVSISNTTIAGNLSYYQGGAIWSDGTLKISNSTVSDNYSDFVGGGIWNSGTLEVSHSTFAANSSWSLGGGVWNNGTLEVSHVSFSKNSTGGNGGGIANRDGGLVVIIDSTFSENSSRSTGGAIDSYRGLGPVPPGSLKISRTIFAGNYSGSGAAVWNDAPAEIVESTFTGNTARSAGGAISHRLATMRITNSTLANNSSGSYGGGIDSWASTVILTGATISGNSAGRDGGAIENYYATVELINSTLSGNSAGRVGGAIDNWGGTVTSTNATITLNRADADGNDSGNGGGIYNYFSTTLLNNTLLAGNLLGVAGSDIPNDISGGNVDLASAHNLIGDAATAGGLTHGANGNIVGVGGASTIAITTVIDTNLADNGGPTLTHALLPGGLAVDFGGNYLVSALTDQTGAPRVLDGNADGIATVDIGAAELVTTDGLFTYLQQQVTELGDIGLLKMGDEVSLHALLTNSQNKYTCENLVGSIELLEVFILRVNKLIESGVLTPEQGQALTGASGMLLDQLNVSLLSASTEEVDSLFIDSSLGSALGA